MAQVIAYQNPNGTNVFICRPTGELPIEEVLAKDCPSNAIIIDDSELPTGDDTEYFEAWELVNGKVIVNLTKKAEIQSAKQFEISTKESALAKIAALGLTQDEIKALL